MSVLVTGATGFIGSHLVNRLLGNGECVRALVRREAAVPALAAAGVDVVRGDLRDAEAVHRAAVGCRIVYHLAKAPSGSSLRTIRGVNVDGTANIGSAVRRAGVIRLVYGSSAAVYGHSSAPGPLPEEALPAPDSAYARSKARAEEVLFSEHQRWGLPVVLARISSVLGPRAARWCPLFHAVAARRFRLLGSGHNRHHHVDVDDVIEGLLLCAAIPGVEGRSYNLAGNEPVSLRELVQLIAQEIGVDGNPGWSLPSGPFRVYKRLSDLLDDAAGFTLPRADGVWSLISSRILDIRRARDELGYSPRVSLRHALHRTVQWCRSEGHLAKWSSGTGASESVQVSSSC